MEFLRIYSTLLIIIRGYLQYDEKYREELKTLGNDDLPELLNEAKLTIIELQREIESLKSEIEELRQQNRGLAAQIESPQNPANLKTGIIDQSVIDSGGGELKSAPAPVPMPEPAPVQAPLAQKESPAAIPLEPVVIVNDNNKVDSSANRKANEHPNPQIASKNGREQRPSVQTSESDNTFVV